MLPHVKRGDLGETSTGEISPEDLHDLSIEEEVETLIGKMLLIKVMKSTTQLGIIQQVRYIPIYPP